MIDGIDWAEVGAGGRFEKIVSTLLSMLHPDSERIDGLAAIVDEITNGAPADAWNCGSRDITPFPLIWRGGDWLEARLAEHLSIVRHFMSANDEYVVPLHELSPDPPI